MAFRKPAGFLITALLLASALLHGCGGSSTDSTTIPTNANVFFAHSAAFQNSSSATSPQPLYTWGYNAFGQVGNGTLDTMTAAFPVPGLPPVDRFATGANHTLAVAFANVSSVYGWGWNRQGQIGPDPAPATQAHSQVPVRIALGGVVREIAAGGVHSLAVVDVPASAGEVRAWGLNSSGQVGNQTFSDTVPVPAPVFGPLSSVRLAGITRLAAGSSHSLALNGAGAVFSWGLNESGQLGRGSASSGDRNMARAVSGLPAAVSQIVAGGSTSYARIGSQVWFWGYNPTTKEQNFTPRQINVLRNGVAVPIVDISAGWDHLLMLADDGTVWSWGFNGRAQLGDGTIVNSATPVQVRFSPGVFLTGVTRIIAFGNHSLARSNGVWLGWGDNANGQLGNPISTTSIGYIMVPTPVAGL